MDDDNEKIPADPSTATNQGAGKEDNDGGDATEEKMAKDPGTATSQGAGKEG